MSFVRFDLSSAFLVLSAVSGVAACESNAPVPIDPDTLPVAEVDRFSDSFGKLFKRSGPGFNPSVLSDKIPAPNEPIDADADWTVQAFGPSGEQVDYYTFDIVSDVPQRGFFFIYLGDGSPVAGALPVFDSLPGEDGYSDFVRVTEVTVPVDFVPNSLTSAADVDAAIAAGDATAVETDRIENWVIVPKGSTADRNFNGAPIGKELALVDGAVAHAFTFEKDLTITAGGTVPTSGIVVIFADDMSPAEGFAVDDTGRTHNVLETVASDADYSSLWAHQRGALAGFDDVTTWESALDNVAGPLPVNVNCPVLD